MKQRHNTSIAHFLYILILSFSPTLLYGGRPASSLQRIPCTYCLKKFRYQSELTVHKRIHTGAKPFACQYLQCGKKFNQKGQQTKHHNLHAKKPYMCTHCKKLFAEESDVTMHQKIHTDPKPFLCKICQREFSDRSNRNRHEKTHSNVKPFKCTICERTSKRKDDMKNHQHIHATDSPRFQCDKCGETFYSPYNIKRHQQNINACKPTILPNSQSSISSNIAIENTSSQYHSLSPLIEAINLISNKSTEQ